MKALILASTALFGVFFQEDPAKPRPEEQLTESTESPRIVQWMDGQSIPVRVPVAVPDRELMTTVSFPETRIETAISGWGAQGTGTLTATARGNLLFLRLGKPATGHLQVLGASGRHYLLLIEGIPEVPEPATRTPDAYVRITVTEDESKADGQAKSDSSETPDPNRSPAITLIRAMRLGENPRDVRVLRAGGEVALTSKQLEICLAYVYQLGSWTGRIYDVVNLTDNKLAIDVTRLGMKDEDLNKTSTLVASALRENVIPANGKTRLYMVFFSRRN